MLQMTVKVKIMGYTVLAYSFLVDFHNVLQFQARPTNGINYICHIKAVIWFNLAYWLHIMLLYITQLASY